MIFFNIFQVYYGIDGSIKSKKVNWRQSLGIDSQIDAYDTPYHKWYTADVIEINNNSNEIKIAWHGYDSTFDIWLDRDSDRIAKFGTYTKQFGFDRIEKFSTFAEHESLSNQISNFDGYPCHAILISLLYLFISITSAVYHL